MEAHMVRRTDHPLQVRVSFEATRLGPQHLIEAYARLVPTVRRTNLRPERRRCPIIQSKNIKGGGIGR